MPYSDHEHHKNQKRNAAPILEVRDLSVSFDKQEVLRDISFSVNEGEVLAIIGPNGAGKTVLFRALMDLIPYNGEVKWREDAQIGYVPQKLFEKAELPLTVKEFFILKSKNLFFKDKQLVESIFHELRSVGLKPEILNQQLTNLSRGQFQRVLIAWAILKHPNVLLFDEPTAGIDLAGEDTIYNLLHKLQNERGMTVLIISHDLSIIYRYADKVLCLNKEGLCFGEPKKALTSEQINKLYGESAFYHHLH
jgi:zinc transport system ATP-binding protein